MAYTVKPYDSYTSKYFGKGYSGAPTKWKPNKNVVEMMLNAGVRTNTEYIAPQKNRSFLKRSLDVLMTPVYTIAGAAHGAVDQLSGRAGMGSVLSGAWDGFTAGNPFGDGNTKGQYTFSRVMGRAGWNPTDPVGKAVRGTLGFGLDVALDPTTYMTGGFSALAKGTGKATVKAAGGLMTHEAAETLVKSQAAKRGTTLTAEEATRDAAKLTEQYNRIIGKVDAKPVTFGLGNLPFGDKIFGKYGTTVTLSSGDTLRKIGDATLAPAYGKLRKAVYGSKLGELFSTKSALFQAAKVEPERVYDFLRFSEITRGHTGDKIARERLIRDKAKMLNMTPAESKEVLKLMQDKTIWAKVSATVKLLDTSEAKEVKNKLQARRDEVYNQFEDLRVQKMDMEDLRTKVGDDIYSNSAELKKAKQAYQEKLRSLNTKHIADEGKLDSLLKMYSDELAEIGAKTASKTADVPDKAVVDDILNKFNELNKKFAARKAGDKTVNIEEKFDLTDKLSTLLYGQKGFIAPTTKMNHINDIIKMVQKGESTFAIREAIEKKGAFFTGRANEIHEEIGRIIGYGKGKKHESIEDLYYKPLQKFTEKVSKGEPLKGTEKAELASLQQIGLHYQMLKGKFYDMNPDQFKAYLKESANQRMMKDFEDIEHLANTSGRNAPRLSEQRRSKFADNDAASIGRKVANDDTPYSKELINAETSDIYNEIYSRMFSQGSIEMSPAKTKYAYVAVQEAQELLTNFFKKDFASLTDNQKDLLVDMSFKNANKRAGGQEVMSKLDRKDIERANKIMQKRLESSRIEAITSRVEEGTIVKFYIDGKPWKGEVINVPRGTSGVLTYTVRTNDGKTHKLFIGDVKGVSRGTKTTTPDEMIAHSEAATDSVKRAEELTKSIDDLKKQISEGKKSLSAEKAQALNEYTSKAASFKQNIADLEKTKQLYDDTIESGAFDELDTLADKLAKADELIANDDALETYIRATFGNRADDWVKEAESKTAKLMLDTMPIDDKIKNIVKVLRGEFKDIAESEIKIGKLTREQADNLMYEYVPHIVTGDGAKHFASKRAVKEHGSSVTNDLGYGLKFNPYSKSRTFKTIKMQDGTWINNPTIEQINEYMGQFLKGKNAFSENVADIYIARALKNSELLYDDQYMKTMMDQFGNAYNPTRAVPKGYKAVVNIGTLRQSVRAEIMNGIKATEKSGRTADVEAIKAGVLDKYGITEEILVKNATPMVELTQDTLAKLGRANPKIIREVNDAIVTKANTARKLQIAKDESRFLQVYDKFLHIMKLNQTTVMPSFHVRNKMSNMYLNWLAVGRDAVNPMFQKDAFNAIRHQGDISKVKGSISIPQADGTVKPMPWNEVYEQAKIYGVIDEGAFAKDIGAGSAMRGKIKALPAKFDPTDTENFVLYKKGMEIGTLTENTDRILHFASQLMNGKTVEQASESSRKYLFDYSDLTAFEQGVMKRIMPYYTWLRKNGALQLRELIDQPEKLALVAKAQAEVEAQVAPEDRIDRNFVSDFAKDWTQTPFNYTNAEGKKEPILFNPALPFMDLARLPDPTDPINSLKQLFAQTSPQIKVPIEQAINRNVFFDSPIVEEGENQSDERLKHLASQFALYNAGEGAIAKDGLDKGLHALNSLTGVKLLSYDYETFKNMRIAEMMKEREETAQK